MNNHTIQAAAVEVQRRTPEALQRTEEPYAGLLPHVEVKLKASAGVIACLKHACWTKRPRQGRWPSG